MSNTALNSKSFNTQPQVDVAQAMNELVAAMPIVIFAKAILAAFQRPAVSPVAAKRSASN